MTTTNPKSKYDLFSKSKARSLISDIKVYQQKQEYVSRNIISLNKERFTKNAYTSRSFSDLIDLLNKLAGNMTPPTLEILSDIDSVQFSAVQNDIMECHTSITNILVQLFSKLCDISENSNVNALEIAIAKCKLEEQIIGYNLYHPFDFKKENSKLMSLRVFIAWLIPSIKKTGAATLPKPSINPSSIADKEKFVTKEKPVSEKLPETPKDKFPIEQSVIDTTSLNILEVANKVDQKFTQAISVQFIIIDKMKKFMKSNTDMSTYMNQLESSVAKQLISQYKFGIIKPPIMFFVYKMCDWVFEDSYTGGPIRGIETYLPGVSCTLTKKTSRTTAEEQLEESSVQDNKTDEALKTLENELENEVIITDKTSSELNSYVDKSSNSELSMYADIYADLTTKALNAGGSGGIDAEIDSSEDTGTDSKYATAIEAAVTNMSKARSNQIDKANRTRQKNKLKRSTSSVETTDETSGSSKFVQPNRHSQLNVITRDLKAKSLTITTLTGIELYFSNGLTTKRIDIANLDQDLADFLDEEGVKRIKKGFLGAFLVYDYRNRAIDLRDRTCPYLRVDSNEYGAILKATLKSIKKVKDDSTTDNPKSQNNNKTEEDIEFDEIDQHYVEKHVVGVIVSIKDEVTDVDSPLTEIEAGLPALNEIECRTNEQILEEKDYRLKMFEKEIESKDIMLEHCKNLVSNGSPELATDTLQRLFTSANDMFDKSVLLHQTGTAQQNQNKK
jgi:hypothetical protein